MKRIACARAAAAAGPRKGSGGSRHWAGAHSIRMSLPPCRPESVQWSCAHVSGSEALNGTHRPWLTVCVASHHRA
eukprot:scaffold122037_cov31-Tisochrysis_lutea.AAC.3